ncbi:MAG: hypothetical protein D6834_03370 [Aquificota bacterium]|nr:MAG: hypothetical protein D6834_03370 [Aquificota bacterium]
MSNSENLKELELFIPFYIPVESQSYVLTVLDGILEVHHPDHFKRGILVSGENLRIPDLSSFHNDHIMCLPLTKAIIKKEHNNQFNSNPLILKQVFLPSPKIQFSSEFLNTFYSILKILNWHIKDSARQPISINIIKMECSKLEISSDLLIQMVLRILIRKGYLRSISESSYVIKEDIDFNLLLLYVRSMINSGIPDPWYFYQLQRYLLKYFSNLQIIAVSNEFKLDEDEIKELLEIFMFEWSEIQSILNEWQQQKIVKVNQQENSSEFVFQFSSIQNEFSALKEKEEAVRELVQIHYILQNEILAAQDPEIFT